ncbi:sigma-54-dependent Fis family transcriptional regulator [Bacillus sp. JJ1764]|uniref:sigma-54-dependent Fis family transcriptional regulator n=1 Tax=Bacillus sp. JJ1764 TaxID=3122964 RepID=UPI002FFE440C
MTSRLMEFQVQVQEIAAAISAALKLDTEIVDENMTVVAGTGHIVKRINHKEENGSKEAGFLYGRVLTTNRPYIIEDARNDPNYDPSYLTSQTEEFAEICCPIRFKGRAIGVIGLLAFTQHQQQQLIENKHQMLEFLQQMEKLLAGKITEQEAIKKLQLTTNQLNTIIESIHEGIMAIDASGIINHVNPTAEILMERPKEELIGFHLSKILPGSPMLEVLINGQEYKEKEESYEVNGVQADFLVSTSPIRAHNRIIGAVASFRKSSDVRKLAFSMTSLQRISSMDEVIGDSEPLKKLKEQALKVCNSQSTILITGETGTGKGLLAMAIHNAGNRYDGPFININCGAIPESLLESELFGYENGAFTGARHQGKAGKFELADKGTIFLDEIGDMPLHLQIKLLHVLQNKEIERIGGTKAIPINVRVIAATNKNLEQMVSDGEFRADLYFRLNVIPISMPSLRERAEDIPILMNHFLHKHMKIARKYVEKFDHETISILTEYTWPGNIRELENAVEYAVNMETTEKITPSSLPRRIFNWRKPKEHANHLNLKKRLQQEEKQILSHFMKNYGTSVKAKKKMANELEISLATLYRKLEEYDLLNYEKSF